MADAPTPKAPTTDSEKSPSQGELPTAPPADASTDLPEAVAALRTGSAITQLPAQFGRYRLEKLLGKGGMGAVYLAHDDQLDRYVALKVPFFGPNDDGLRERFFREARAAATLQHPNLCPVFDVAVHDGVHYLTMAYVEGRSLSSYIRPDRQLPVQQVAGLVRILAKALQEAHEQGVIHRDLKPANIMINRKKQPVIMDFGLARREESQDSRLTNSGAIMGTPAYMAPEQVNGDIRAMGPATDVYALGVILYELLTGKRPFDGAVGSLMAQIVADPPPRPTRLRPDLDSALEAICLKALAKRPEDRYASMEAFASAIERWMGGKSQAPSPLPEPPLLTPAPAALPVVAAPTKSAQSATKVKSRSRRTQPHASQARGLSSGARWTLLICGIVFGTCVLPAGIIVLIIQQIVGQVSEGVSKAGKLIDDHQKEQNRLREEQKKEEQQLEEAMRAWKALPADTSATRLFPKKVDKFSFVSSDANAAVSELKLDAPGRRATYRNGSITIELTAYHVDKLAKETIFRHALEAIVFQGGFPGLLGGPSVRGSEKGPCLIYDRPAASGTAEQHGAFVWGEDSLFLARATSSRDASAFLKDYLAAVSREPTDADDKTNDQ